MKKSIPSIGLRYAPQGLTDDQLILRIRKRIDWHARWGKAAGIAMIASGIGLLIVVLECIFVLLESPPNSMTPQQFHHLLHNIVFLLGFASGLMASLPAFGCLYLATAGFVMTSNPHWKDRLVLRLDDRLRASVENSEKKESPDESAGAWQSTN